MNRLFHKECPLCKSNEIGLELQVRDHSISQEDFEIYSCKSCNSKFTVNPPIESEIGPYYESEQYISHSNTQKGLIYKVYHAVRKFMFSQKYRLIEKQNTSKTVLDVGSGTGYFLNYMQSKGYQVQGIEVSDQPRNASIQNFGLRVNTPDKLIAGKIEGKFGIITMWHVLEHIYDPYAYIAAIKNLLEPGGKLVVAVPNPNSFDAQHYKSFWAGYDVPRHLWHFTPDTMEKFAKNCGLSIKSLNRLPFDSFYVSLLSEKYKGSSLGLLFGMIIGKLSFLVSLFNIKKTSSVIYVMEQV